MENLQPKLRFPEFDGNWNNYELKEIVDFHNNKRVPLKDSDRNGLKKVFPYYGASGIIDYVDKYLFDGEYILLGEDGANILTRSTRLSFIANGKFWVNNHAHVFSAKNDYSNYFICEYLETLDYSKYNSGTAQPKLNSKIVSSIPLNIPSLPEQTKIADFLGAVDKQLELLTTKKEKLQLYKKGVMQKLFSQQIRFTKEDGSNYPDWEEKTLGEIGEIVSGLTYSPDNISENGVLVLRSSNIQDNKLSFLDNVYVEVKKYNPVKKNDILICVRNGSKDLIGKNALITKDIEGCAFGAFMTVYRSQYNLFISQWMQHKEFKKYVHKNLGATINSINGNDLKKFKLNLPNEEEQTKIADFLSAIDNQIEAVNNQITKTENYKKGLLQQMFV